MNQSRPLIIISHLIGWMLFVSLIIGFVSTFSNSGGVIDHFLSTYFFVFLLFYVALFYFNTGILFPQLYLRKRYVYYFSIIAVLLVAVYFVRPFDQLISGNRQTQDFPDNFEMRQPPMQPGGPPPPGMDGRFEPRGDQPRQGPHTDIISVILFFMILSFSSALQILKQWRLTEQRAARAETEKATAELSFLKAQINPHFLFNTLNNIYSMAVTKHASTPDSIMKLSQIMRYVTDEVTQDLVALQSEADCASDYIALQQLRLNKKVKIEFSVNGNTENKQIPPLIFMPFIENVFKYGISSHEESTAVIKISTEEKVIHFCCQNKIFNNLHIERGTGIGIANTKKRLEHQYGNTHALIITDTDGLYTVRLSLPVISQRMAAL